MSLGLSATTEKVVDGVLPRPGSFGAGRELRRSDVTRAAGMGVRAGFEEGARSATLDSIARHLGVKLRNPGIQVPGEFSHALTDPTDEQILAHLDSKSAISFGDWGPTDFMRRVTHAISYVNLVEDVTLEHPDFWVRVGEVAEPPLPDEVRLDEIAGCLGWAAQVRTMLHEAVQP